MVIKNRIFALVFRAVGIVMSIAGIVASLFQTGSFHAGTLLYYTLMSNIVVSAYFIITLVLTAKDVKGGGKEDSPSYFPKLSMVLAIDILLTMTVYWGMLVPATAVFGSDLEIFSFGNVVAHTITPLLMIADCILLNKRGALKPVHCVL
ncbi:MAG: hypothetical protein LBN25_02780, partial [Christensenellaceae bacterium]|nr:hypothetical protein [Christensenellaceae bacterium]